MDNEERNGLKMEKIEIDEPNPRYKMENTDALNANQKGVIMEDVLEVDIYDLQQYKKEIRARLQKKQEQELKQATENVSEDLIWLVVEEQKQQTNRLNGFQDNIDIEMENSIDWWPEMISREDDIVKFDIKNKESKENKEIFEQMINDCVKEIEDIVEKGFFPCQVWLLQNGHNELALALKNYPSYFHECLESITTESYITIAQNLANEHNGLLPDYVWLRTRGYYRLLEAMHIDGKAFKNIKQKSRRKSIEENVAIAEKLVEENSGVLPEPRFLIKKGYGSLYHDLVNHPESFKHIKQDNWERGAEGNRHLIEMLLKENKGKMPAPMWLKENGYVFFYKEIRKHARQYVDFIMKVKEEIENEGE